MTAHIHTARHSSLGLRSGLMALWLLLLAACSGGGDSVTPQPAPTTGSVTQTGRALDLAIDGDGLFALEAPEGGRLYSRYGRFDIDQEGHLVHASGARLVGHGPQAPETAVAGSLPAVAWNLPAVATSRVHLQMNLDSREGESFFTTFDPVDATTYSRATSVPVFDAEGHAVSLTLYFRRAGADAWSVFATANGTGSTEPIATLSFHPDGTLLGDAVQQIDIPAFADGLGGTTEAIPGLALDFGGSSQYGSGFAISGFDVDGSTAGRLTTAAVSEGGAITLAYDNGRTLSAGQLLLAKFDVADRLVPRDDALWSCERECRAPLLAAPASALLGALLVGALESDSH